ncbi:Hypothetical predicted protein [Mytilus galloprovincialis]|uniref:Reverse transcriptase domain-containing protein n=1 Tax=Mytilus galloprovincialis TaxID=29158 RepID=A0A8B6D359_MYTGA|nr:Hypothetical predicted protein [Mytilus galloprovincialis]
MASWNKKLIKAAREGSLTDLKLSIDNGADLEYRDKFRANQFATCTDIEKAFLHVGLSEEDRDVTRFLWLSDPTNPGSQLKTYRFKAVLFGATSSPFILNATIQKHLKQFGNSETAKILERDIYVDNILSSMNKEEDLLTYFKEARSLMAGAGFNLRSWSSNSAKLLELAKEENVLDTDKYTKYLECCGTVEATRFFTLSVKFLHRNYFNMLLNEKF